MASPKLQIFLALNLVLIFVAVCCLASRDFYKILGVARDASQHEIKKSFRRQAMKLHPDKNLDNKDATKNFQDLREAFEVISDPKKRRLYDEGGGEPLKRAKTSGRGGYYAEYHNGYRVYRTYPFGYQNIDPLGRYYASQREPSLIDRIFRRFIEESLEVIHYITSRESFLTFVILTICALITSIILYNTPSSFCNNTNESGSPSQNGEDLPSFKQNQSKAYENSSNATTQSNTSQPTTPIAHTSEDLKIMELKAETYNGMIRLLKPGYRSIILLTDRENKEKLMPQFKKAVWPYRRNKTLLFGYLCLDKNLNWYKSLLQEVTGIIDLNVNKRNCNGTVLSLNGFKKYFRVYHAKHNEQNGYGSDTQDDDDDDEASFLGFENNRDEEECIGGDLPGANSQEEGEGEGENPAARPLVVDHLLDRLPIWLDKIFDGMTKRYFLDSWPEEIK